jgi:D-arabinose 1-dehydrogenase-like Zn-dependent alcohol dehydrogenase
VSCIAPDVLCRCPVLSLLLPCAVAVPRSGKTILVTGATDGTGFHCARAFAQHGARVIIHGRNEEKARRCGLVAERQGLWLAVLLHE